MYNCDSLSSLFLWGQGQARGLERQVAAIRRIILEHPPAVIGCEKNGHTEYDRKNVGQGGCRPKSQMNRNYTVRSTF